MKSSQPLSMLMTEFALSDYNSLSRPEALPTHHRAVTTIPLPTEGSVWRGLVLPTPVHISSH